MDQNQTSERKTLSVIGLLVQERIDLMCDAWIREMNGETLIRGTSERARRELIRGTSERARRVLIRGMSEQARRELIRETNGLFLEVSPEMTALL